MSTPETKPGFLSAGITALSPWSSRSATPKPSQPPKHDEDKVPGTGTGAQRGGDHIVKRHRISPKKYPSDCPPLRHLLKIPKRKPFASTTQPSDKPAPRPKKFIPFSASDSRAIEKAFQKLADEEEASEEKDGALATAAKAAQRDEPPKQTSTKVPVNEDYLFDVEIETRELAPAYWMGPVYDVKRGTWFTPDGDPCDENLAHQLEEGYLKLKPWRFAKSSEQTSSSQPRTRPVSLNVKPDEDYRKLLSDRQSTSNPVTPQSSMDNLRGEAEKSKVDEGASAHNQSPTSEEGSRTHRLFGAYMNSVVTYQDDTTAWLLTDDFLSRMGSTLYQRFAGGAHYGAKYIRGYVDPATKKSKAKDERAKQETHPPDNSPLAYGDGPNKRPTPASSEAVLEAEAEHEETPAETRRRTLERHVSSLMISSQTREDSEQQEEEIRRRDEQEMREDYKDQSKAEQGREIEHLLLVTHGIGQRLGIRMESVNFIHDVNSFRKSLKSTYSNSPDLQALNSEVDQDLKNNRIQVLPIVWRHLLDFPKQSLKHNRKEHDLGDLDHDDEDYPNLEDITVEGVPAVRNLLTDLALDILLYQSPAYKGHISRIVLTECNRIYRLFKQRNPTFKGKVSLVGHSLGSAIMFDILCQQKTAGAQSQIQPGKRPTDENLQLDFEVEDFYALGSPIGLFQMLKGRTIAARPSNTPFVPPETPQSPLDDPFSPTSKSKCEHAFEITTSSPACRQLFNIFHPTDPISYRLEPLISPAMSALKPQPLPYTKKGLFSASGAQGLTGIGARVGQGVTDFWTSVSSGIASGLLNRSLGLTGADATKMQSDLTHGQRSSRPLSITPGTGAGSDDPARAFVNEERKKRLAGDDATVVPRSDGEHPATLIDSEMETLYAGFQKRRSSQQPTGAGGEHDTDKDDEWRELEEKSRKLRKEEAKVRALNANGRVDYSIQEGAFDISLLASIASHLSYWADEDVSHFIISQLLARNRVLR
ncbi:DDHD-domain-containing protein, partial [Westerdykella ornata]